MTGKPACSIVIRAFNEGQHIGRLLQGIQAQTVDNVEVIVVDSGSSDETVAIAERYGSKIVRITPEAFTFGRSLNWGVAAATGALVVNISAHCYPVYPDWLEKLLAPLRDREVAVSYGKQRGGKTNHYSEYQFFRKYFPDVSQPRQGQPYSHNANAAIRRSLWEQQPYNEKVTGLEDLAWSSWGQEQGYEIAYVAEAEVIHLHDERPVQVQNRYRREAIALKQILPESQFNAWNLVRLGVSSTVSDWIQARREGVLRQVWKSILWFRWRQYLGTYQGYNFSGEIDAQLHQTFYYPPGSLENKKPPPRRIQPIDYAQTEN